MERIVYQLQGQSLVISYIRVRYSRFYGKVVQVRNILFTQSSKIAIEDSNKRRVKTDTDTPDLF